MLERFRHQVGSQNGAKIDMKGGWKNDEKMMMARMAKKLDIGGYEPVRNPCPDPRGGVPPYCTGHTPTPSKTKYFEAPLAIEQSFKVESRKLLEFAFRLGETSCC